MDRSPPVSVPRLQTTRLSLREHRVEDFDGYAAHVADPESMAFLGIADRRQAWRLFASAAGLWLLQGAGWWTVEVRETGVAVGNVGAFFREGQPGIEIGWNIYRQFWGQGYASEAAAEAARYAFEVRGEPRVRALIDSGNARSIGVARRIGMRYEVDVEHDAKPVGRYTRERASTPARG